MALLTTTLHLHNMVLCKAALASEPFNATRRKAVPQFHSDSMHAELPDDNCIGQKHIPRTVDVVSVGVEAAAVLQGGVESEFSAAHKTFAPKLQPRRHDLHIALAQRIVDHILVLLHLAFGSCSVSDHSACVIFYIPY